MEDQILTDGKMHESGVLGQIEFWFDFSSPYSYLSVMRIGELAQHAGVKIVWRPFLLGPIFQTFGMSTSPFLLQKTKGKYMWRDMARQCQKYRLGWTRPSEFPRMGLLPSRVATLEAGAPWIGAFCRKVMERSFVENRAINEADSVAEILDDLDLDASPLLDLAHSDFAKNLLRQRTEEAGNRGIFGAPTFFVEEEMFWGNDRLDDALQLAVSAGTRETSKIIS
jgi:2-hydroxychromene-2-carboxylate isomerase